MKLKGIFVLIIGLILSIVLHEAFHYIMHYKNIVSVGWFTNNNIIQIVAVTPNNYNILGEEIIAYSITAVVIICTFILATLVEYNKTNKHLKLQF